MVLNLEILSESTDQKMFDQALKQISDAKRFNMLKEYGKLVEEITSERTDIDLAMYFAWMDLFIDPDTGEYLEKFQKLVPRPQEKTHY
jgi:hypothetical protein